MLLLRSFVVFRYKQVVFSCKKCNFFTMVMYIDVLEKSATFGPPCICETISRVFISEVPAS